MIFTRACAVVVISTVAACGSTAEDERSKAPTRGTTISSSIPIVDPTKVAYDPDRNVLYVVHESDVPLNITAEGDYEVAVLDVATKKVTGTIPIGNSAEGIALDGSTLVVTQHGPRGQKINFIDTATNEIVTIDSDGSASDVGVESGTHAVFQADGYVFDTTIREHVVKNRVFGQGIAIDTAAHVAYIAEVNKNRLSVIDTATRKVTGTIDVGKGPNAVAVDATTHTVYVRNSTDQTLSVVDPATKSVTATIPLGDPSKGTGTWNGLVIDPVTHTLYVTNRDENSVTVIDTATNEVVATIPVNGPQGMAIDLATHTVYVSSATDNKVQVIAPGN